MCCCATLAMAWTRRLPRFAAGCAATATLMVAATKEPERRPSPLHDLPGALPPPDWAPRVSTGFSDAVGRTPLIELHSLSRATGCRILAKAEMCNPGGSVKDRTAVGLVRYLEATGAIVPHADPPFTLVEATGGNTGIALAHIAAERGYNTVFTMPASISEEKIALARSLGAEVIVCDLVPFDSPHHFYHTAQRLAATRPRAISTNQFEGLANAGSHYTSTGPEIWAQAGGVVDAVAVAAGTGGTIGGLSQYLREVNPGVKVFLIDVPGSGLATYVETGKWVPASGSTINEGVGIGRLTSNFALAEPVTGAFRGTDQEVLSMQRWLTAHEGVAVGPSAALNVVAAVKAARELGPGHTVVTLLCDSARAYTSKLGNPAYLQGRGLVDGVPGDAGLGWVKQG